MIERTIEHWRALPHLSMRETEAVLGVARGSIEGLVAKGELERVKRCGKWMVTVKSIREYVGEAVETQSESPLPNAPYSAEDRAALRSLKGGR